MRSSEKQSSMPKNTSSSSERKQKQFSSDEWRKIVQNRESAYTSHFFDAKATKEAFEPDIVVVELRNKKTGDTHYLLFHVTGWDGEAPLFERVDNNSYE